jgi:hypothetical protein
VFLRTFHRLIYSPSNKRETAQPWPRFIAIFRVEGMLIMRASEQLKLTCDDAVESNNSEVLCSTCRTPMTVRGEQLVMFVQGLIEFDLVCETCGVIAKRTARPQTASESRIFPFEPNRNKQNDP